MDCNCKMTTDYKMRDEAWEIYVCYLHITKEGFVLSKDMNSYGMALARNYKVNLEHRHTSKIK